jgi:16S rRNA C967 or C1407 C5-methylase (RsmB/RsmF family)
VLADAADFVKPGGRLIYVTCSLLAEENEDRVAAFVERHPGSPSSRSPWRASSNTSRRKAICA